jgi:serine O-acetyltransferase
MKNAQKKGRSLAARRYCYLMEKKYHCRISPGAKIGTGFSLPHPDGVIIGEKCRIGDNVRIYQQVTIGQNRNKYPVIGNNVIIYAGAKIIGDIHIGDNCIVGANAVVTKSIPDNSVVGGIPARIIKKRDPKDKYI